MIKKQYKEFRELLAKGIGDRKQKDFAEEVGISHTHLNRMLNQDYIGQPSKSMLAKMAGGMKGRVTLAELFASCGYDDDAAALSEPEEKLTEHQKRLKLPDTDRLTHHLNDMKLAFRAICDKCRLFPGFDQIFEEIVMLYAVEDVKIHLDKSFSMDKEKYQAENAAVLDIFWEGHQHEVHTNIVLYYNETLGGKVMPMAFSFEGADVDEAGGMPDELTEKFRKYHIDIRTVHDVTVMLPKKSDAEARLLRAIFGDDGAKVYPTTISGFGFYITEKIPQELFIAFLQKHAYPFTSDQLRDLESGVDYETVFESAECPETSNMGFGALISELLSKEAGVSFSWFPSGDDNDACVMYTGDSLLSNDATRVVYQFAKELRIPYIQECYYQTEIIEDTNSIIQVEWED